jgi:hypothetical protein
MGSKLTSMPTFEEMALMLIWCELVNKDLLTLASPMFKSWCKFNGNFKINELN